METINTTKNSLIEEFILENNENCQNIKEKITQCYISKKLSSDMDKQLKKYYPKWKSVMVFAFLFVSILSLIVFLILEKVYSLQLQSLSNQIDKLGTDGQIITRLELWAESYQKETLSYFFLGMYLFAQFLLCPASIMLTISQQVSFKRLHINSLRKNEEAKSNINDANKLLRRSMNSMNTTSCYIEESFKRNEITLEEKEMYSEKVSAINVLLDKYQKKLETFIID